MKVDIIDKLYDKGFIATSNQATEYEIFDVQKRTYHIQDLKPSTKYQISVSAHTNIGKGSAALIEQVTNPVTLEGMLYLSGKRGFQKVELSLGFLPAQMFFFFFFFFFFFYLMM